MLKNKMLRFKIVAKMRIVKNNNVHDLKGL